MGNRLRKDEYEISDKLYKEVTNAGKPVVVAQLGKPNLIIMTEEVFNNEKEQQAYLAEANNKIEIGERALTEGRTVDFELWVKELARKEGFSLDVQD